MLSSGIVTIDDFIVKRRYQKILRAMHVDHPCD